MGRRAAIPPLAVVVSGSRGDQKGVTCKQAAGQGARATCEWKIGQGSAIMTQGWGGAWSEKFEVLTRKTDGFYSVPSDGNACVTQRTSHLLLLNRQGWCDLQANS
jgi:hypothetical protein